MFNSMDRQNETKFMTKLEEKQPEAAEKVRSLMFTFEDLVKLDSSSAQTLLRYVDKSKLSLALKGASEELKDLFFGNMSERAVKIMVEEMAALGRVRLKDVDQAQLDIVNLAKDLEDRGEIFISEGKEEEFIY